MLGKSHTVHAIYQSALRMLRLPSQNPDHPTVLLTASTGKAAVNINGTTVHSTFGILGKNSRASQSRDSLIQKQTLYQNLKILVIDEISMISSELLLQLHIIMQKIFENNMPFGGISILAVGDLQLPPVAASAVFYQKDKTSNSSPADENPCKVPKRPNTLSDLRTSIWRQWPYSSGHCSKNSVRIELELEDASVRMVTKLAEVRSQLAKL